MTSHVHNRTIMTRGTDPQIVELRAQLAGLERVIAEKDRSAERERADQKDARDKAEQAVNARLAGLNALKEQRGEDRATFAPREAVDARLTAIDGILGESREDRAAIHARLDALVSLAQKVDTNSEELDKVRDHVHDMANDLGTLINKPPQFPSGEEKSLHEAAEWWGVRKQTNANRSVELWKAGVALLATVVVIYVLPHMGSIVHALSGN